MLEHQVFFIQTDIFVNCYQRGEGVGVGLPHPMEGEVTQTFVVKCHHLMSVELEERRDFDSFQIGSVQLKRSLVVLANLNSVHNPRLCRFNAKDMESDVLVEVQVRA